MHSMDRPSQRLAPHINFLHASEAELRRQVGERDATIAALRAERDALAKFKEYVHLRLNGAGVPVDPPGEHRDAGCRIGQRLQWVDDRMRQLVGQVDGFREERDAAVARAEKAEEHDCRMSALAVGAEADRDSLHAALTEVERVARQAAQAVRDGTILTTSKLAMYLDDIANRSSAALSPSTAATKPAVTGTPPLYDTTEAKATVAEFERINGGATGSRACPQCGYATMRPGPLAWFCERRVACGYDEAGHVSNSEKRS